MQNQDFFFQAIIYLAAAVVSVPLAKKLGLGSVLGYLMAGIIIGPYVFGLVGNEADKVMHFAEFGVVLMLFVIGLELQPSLLWKMRKAIFGLGGLQVLITTLIITGVAILFQFQLNKALGIGLILALSSTAIVLQTLTEKGLLKNIAGRSAFSVLLFQDISVVPILALIPVLATLIAVLRPVCPPSVGRIASGCSLSMIFIKISGVMGSIYVLSAISGSVMIVAGLELIKITS